MNENKNHVEKGGALPVFPLPQASKKYILLCLKGFRNSISSIAAKKRPKAYSQQTKCINRVDEKLIEFAIYQCVRNKRTPTSVCNNVLDTFQLVYLNGRYECAEYITAHVYNSAHFYRLLRAINSVCSTFIRSMCKMFVHTHMHVFRQVALLHFYIQQIVIYLMLFVSVFQPLLVLPSVWWL